MVGSVIYHYIVYLVFFAVAVSYSTAHPTEDADSRTLYVSNVGICISHYPSYFMLLDLLIYLLLNYLKVHFAATKDSLSRHFNKFGAVLKVVIVTNAATGQPTGSVYF